jgi:hypothetical protein
MHWIEAFDVILARTGDFRRRCVDREVEALVLQSADPDVLA